MTSRARFVVNPVLTAITLGYRNRKLIADLVLPRVPVDSESFLYTKYTQADAFGVPNTLVGRKGEVTEIDWSATQVPGRTFDYGLDDLIPVKDERLAAAYPGQPVDPLGRSTELLSDLIALDREVRVANLVFGASNYLSAQKTTLSGSDQWSDSSSTPIADINGALDAMLMRPTVMVIGRLGFTALSTHPDIVKAYHANAGDVGIAPAQFIAALFGLDQVLIGDGFVNTAKKGQTPTIVRAWGANAALLYQNPLITSPDGSGVTFGLTAQWGVRVSGTMDEPKIGLRGSTRVRVGEAVNELVTASDCGYLFTAVA